MNTQDVIQEAGRLMEAGDYVGLTALADKYKSNPFLALTIGRFLEGAILNLGKDLKSNKKK